MSRLQLLGVGLVLLLLAGCAGGADEEGQPADGADTPASSAAEPAEIQFRRVTASSDQPDAAGDTVSSDVDCSGFGATPVTPPDEPVDLCDVAGVVYRLGEAEVVGTVVSAESTIHEGTGTPTLTIELDEEATEGFADISVELVGTGERLALVVDGVVLTAPVFESEITDGELQISGGMTKEQTDELAARLTG